MEDNQITNAKASSKTFQPLLSNIKPKYSLTGFSADKILDEKADLLMLPFL